VTWLGISDLNLNKMKTAEQWANRVQNSKEPWAKLVAEIQTDALLFAQEQIMESSTQSGALNKIMAAMPNDRTERSGGKRRSANSETKKEPNV
jgi:hypothetical protein